MASKDWKNKLKYASMKEDDEKVNSILENLEDEYNVDLSSFYGEKFDDKKIKELEKKLK